MEAYYNDAIKSLEALPEIQKDLFKSFATYLIERAS
jgi:hypothetical protein